MSSSLASARAGRIDCGQLLTGDERTPRDEVLGDFGDPQLPWEGVAAGLHAPADGLADQQTHSGANRGGVFRFAIKLTIQQEVIHHAMQAAELFALQPRKTAAPQRHVHPLAQRLGFVYAKLAQLWPDGNARIRRENVRREADI